MTLLTFSLFLGGLGAAIIPVLLHLLMRTKPKTVELPTLRFVQGRLVSNRRRFMLKHIFLLLLRMGLLILLGLLLARPLLRPSESLTGFSTMLTGPERTAAAVAIVFDTSIRMGYLHHNETRLDTAKKFAQGIVEQLSGDSQVAIISGTSHHDSFQVDLLAAREKIKQLDVATDKRPVCESVLRAMALLRESNLNQRELFVLTDCTRPGWPASFEHQLKQEITLAKKAGGDIACYLIDVGQKNIQNSTILDLGLSSESGTINTPFRMEVTLAHHGDQKPATVELCLLDLDDGQTISSAGIKLLEQSVDFPSGQSIRTVVFQLPLKQSGIQLGYVRYTGEDALAADNIRWFALNVQESRKILLVGQEPSRENTLFVREALAPYEFRKEGRALFEVEHISQKEWAKKSLKDLRPYRAIVLLDPFPLSLGNVKTILAYTQEGGGLGIFLGRNAVPLADMQTPEMFKLLGGKLTGQVRIPEGNVWLKPNDEYSPLLASFRQMGGGEVPWSAMTVSRYWQMTELAETVTTPLSWSDGRPAFMVRSLGEGTVVVGTTPLSDPASLSPWNHFVTGDASWVYLMLMDGIARTLASGGNSIFNYYLMEPILRRPEITALPENAMLSLPDGEQILISVDSDLHQIRLAEAEQPGIYRLQSLPNKEEESLNDGFAVNYRSEQFDLTPLSEKELKDLWKDTPLQWIDNLRQVELKRGESQTGRELFPLLLLLFGLLLVGESVVANRFY